ncbi:MAG: carbamoyl-phosphate synthase large subunit [Bacillota bacterium]|nr:carbamoyl-phosphate synthase large subunit [Bacillota bacterium]MDW7682787.1 carbamoyl-phosphate synthase large subunit [Bacillota bacterium]
MPRTQGLKRVLVIGSGPIVIGQAAEFDYAGTQACKALREEGCEVVLVNSNPATIMTDPDVADRVYLEPLTPEFISRVIEREKPDGLLPTLGGQTALNLAKTLTEAGILEKYGVRLLGTSLDAIQRAEDRELFKMTMEEIGEPIPQSAIISSLDEAVTFAKEVGFPLIIRPAYTMGGAGGGFATDVASLRDVVSRGLKHSLIGQALLERSVKGWKEIEFEVLRDANDNCITICSMENFDPAGVHTGDSIVFAPAQTLRDVEYQMLRTASLKIIRALKIEGGCNVQYALDTKSQNYIVIEVNPRVSRSSALASKATGYPIAKVATKIAVGLHLDEIENSVTGKTTACFEPTIDYVVSKIPRWPFDKFQVADRRLGTQMKATGEVMAIGRTMEESLLKAVRSLEIGVSGLQMPVLAGWSDRRLQEGLEKPTDERLFVLAEALRRGMSVIEAERISTIDRFFMQKVSNIVTLEKEISGMSLAELTGEKLLELKRTGFADAEIAQLIGCSAADVREKRHVHSLRPVYKMVDTCAAEFEAVTPYYYSAYDLEDEVAESKKEKVLVLGSGPIRIGQGIEFDYCSVHSVWGLKAAGREAIIINNNPETVSTDFDCADKLYFDPLTVEDVLEVIDREKPAGVVVQFGGQTAINLAGPLDAAGVNILGTPVAAIDLAEDREKFNKLLFRLGIPQPEGVIVRSPAEALGAANKLGFPLLVRPSYVIGGRAMQIVYNEEQLYTYLKLAANVTPEHPVLLDRYLLGTEVEVDAVCDGETVLIPGIFEHIERAGVHSGDSMAVFPPQSLREKTLKTVVAYTKEISLALGVKGLVNIQYVVWRGRVYVLEVNPRASRTVPIISKVTNIPLVALATRIMLGETLKSMGYVSGLVPHPDYITVKAPVFSFEKLHQVDISLGPEMKSTGEVLGIDRTFTDALYKTMLASGFTFPETGAILASVAEKDKKELIPLLVRAHDFGFDLYATEHTARSLREAGVSDVKPVYKVGEGLPNVLDLIREGKIDLAMNTPTYGKNISSTGYQVRRTCVEYKVPCLTSTDTAAAFFDVLVRKGEGSLQPDVVSLQEYLDGEVKS